MDYKDRIPLAAKALHDGYMLHDVDDFAGAMKCYAKSVALWPTAEGYTYYAWALSLSENDYEGAIELCKRAIEINKEYGNPYNDIGAYLVQLGKIKESIHWFEMALSVESYDMKHYAYFNLGRVYEELGDKEQAIENYMGSLKIEPDYEMAQLALAGILGSD